MLELEALSINLANWMDETEVLEKRWMWPSIEMEMSSACSCKSRKDGVIVNEPTVSLNTNAQLSHFNWNYTASIKLDPLSLSSNKFQIEITL